MKHFCHEDLFYPHAFLKKNEGDIVIASINERYKAYQTGFSFCRQSCPRGGTLGRWGAQGVNFFYFKHGHVAYQIDRDEEQNRMQVKFSS